jgi:hypothetical protein
MHKKSESSHKYAVKFVASMLLFIEGKDENRSGHYILVIS